MDGSGETRLSENANQIYPSMNPVDDRLLTAGNIPGAPKTRIYVRASESSTHSVIAEEIGIVAYNPDWSPDGKRIRICCTVR
jgi:Tol biopolymer transport system component